MAVEVSNSKSSCLQCRNFTNWVISFHSPPNAFDHKNTIPALPIGGNVQVLRDPLLTANVWPSTWLWEKSVGKTLLGNVWKISWCCWSLIKLALCQDGKSVVINPKGSFSWAGSFSDENRLPVFRLHQWYSDFFDNCQLCTSQSAEKWEFHFFSGWEKKEKNERSKEKKDEKKIHSKAVLWRNCPAHWLRKSKSALVSIGFPASSSLSLLLCGCKMADGPL